MRRKLCFGLLLVLFTIFGLSLNVCSDASAASVTWTGNWSIYDVGSGQWILSPSGSFLSISTGFETTQLRYVKQNYGNILAGNTITTSATFIVLYDYYQGAINSPAQINCPVLRHTATTISCDIDVSFDVSGGQHFAVYSWTNVSYVTQDITNTSLYYNFYFKNNNSSSIRLYSTGLNFSVGDSELALNTQAIQSFNRDVSSYIGSVVSSINANGNDLESAITSLNNDFNSFRTNTYNQLNSIDSNVSNIWEYLQDKQDQDEEDRDNIEEQSSDIDSESSDSSSDAEQQGTTLLGAFSAFVTALTSASPSNCVLDMDLGNLDLGNVDFCTLSPPQPVPTIASIFLILFCVPLSIATAKKVINLFRSFQ